MQQQTHDQRGFTLVETTIALLVMMVVGLGAASLFVYSIKNNGGAGDRAMAMAVAQQQMEELRRVSFSNSNLAATTGTTSTVNIAVSGVNRPFRVVTTIADTTTTLKTITIQVYPPNNNGQSWASTPVTLQVLRASSSTGSYLLYTT